jgi:isopentenyl diphosphate isomerase/L-lactate dehydrogenase-like FMN-dependent dehydrogenase
MKNRRRTPSESGTASKKGKAFSRKISSADRNSLFSIQDFEVLAEKRVMHGVWERIQGGAADEITLRWNREAWQRIRLQPRSLVDVSNLDTRVTLFGQELPFPILLAPTGAQGLIQSNGDLQVAAGAAAAQATLVISSSGSVRVEEVARHARGPVWFQLYVQRDRGFTKEPKTVAAVHYASRLIRQRMESETESSGQRARCPSGSCQILPARTT